MNNTPTPKLTVYENRGGEVWERHPDGRRELFAEDIIRKLTTQERELTAAREELKVVTEQRDAASAEFYRYHGLWDRATKQLETVMYQRDRLAEAIITHQLRHFFAREALQSLNPDHTVDANDMIAAVKGGGTMSEENDRAICCTCKNDLELVRPGKHQCNVCDDRPILRHNGVGEADMYSDEQYAQMMNLPFPK